MKHALLLPVLSIVLLTGCATAYRTGQTPDDVYYSPGRVVEERQDASQQRQDEAYQEYISSMDDRYLRMKIANRYRWDMIDNFSYWNDSRYDFGYNYYSSGINPYSSWYPGLGFSAGYGYGNYYAPGYGYGYGYGWNNPVCSVVYYTIPHYGRAAGFTAGSNLSAYRNHLYSNSNYGYKDERGVFVPASNSSFGSLLKKVFSNDNGTTTSYDRAARTFTPSNNNTAPATSSSAGGASGGFKSTGSSTSTGRGGRG